MKSSVQKSIDSFRKRGPSRKKVDQAIADRMAYDKAERKRKREGK